MKELAFLTPQEKQSMPSYCTKIEEFAADAHTRGLSSLDYQSELWKMLRADADLMMAFVHDDFERIASRILHRNLPPPAMIHADPRQRMPKAEDPPETATLSVQPVSGLPSPRVTNLAGYVSFRLLEMNVNGQPLRMVKVREARAFARRQGVSAAAIWLVTHNLHENWVVGDHVDERTAARAQQVAEKAVAKAEVTHLPEEALALLLEGGV